MVFQNINRGLITRRGTKVKRNQEKAMFARIKLENRANTGLRIVSSDFKKDDKRIFVTVDMHHPKGKYLLEENNAVTHQREPSPVVEFSKFQDVESFMRNKYKLPVVRDTENSNNAHTWEENIKIADHELPLDKIYWSLPENVLRKDNQHESTEAFLKRIGKIK